MRTSDGSPPDFQYACRHSESIGLLYARVCAYRTELPVAPVAGAYSWVFTCVPAGPPTGPRWLLTGTCPSSHAPAPTVSAATSAARRERAPPPLPAVLTACPRRLPA